MTVYYQHIRAVIDPDMSDPLPGGGRLQDVSVILVDRPGGGEPIGIALLACCTACACPTCAGPHPR
jgi:hypothetical protein